ncbi:MAG: hypothetical protein Q8O93_01230 [bacterium]|nr:hypothetical protein [bacterium]
MTIKVRRILSLIFFLLFITVTPAIMLYAAGYKLGSNGLSIERTGMFIIDSKPKGAVIYLNGKPREAWISSILNKKEFITTPAKIKNLLPGEYDLKIELDGYWSWEKKLTVNPGASTFAENIYLFKDSLPTQIASGAAATVKLSPDKTQTMILSPGRLAVINLLDETEKTAAAAGLSGKNSAWSDRGNKIIIDDWLYDLNNWPGQTDLKKILPDSSDYKWSGGDLYYRDKNSIYRLSGSNLPHKIIGNENFSDYLIKNDYLYLIGGSGQAASLKVIELSGAKLIKEISLPAAAAGYIFINREQSLLNIYDAGHEMLYLLDPLSSFQPLADVISNIKISFWVNSDSLLYANDFEIWLYRPSSKQKTLITRISEQINNLIMHPGRDHIIYSTAKTINAIELDEREKRNITELVKFDSIKTLSLNSKGDVIYFSGKIGNSEGLYKFLIQ